MTIQILLHVCIILGYGIPIGFYFINRLFAPAIILIIFGLIWVFPKLRSKPWLQGIALVVGIAGNVFGSILSFPSYEMLLSTVLILGTCEFTRFDQYLKLASEEDSITIIKRRHGIISIIFFSLVFLLSLGVVQMKIEPNFYQAVVMVILAFIGVIQLFRWLISTSKES